MEKLILIDLNVLIANKKELSLEGKPSYVNREIKALLNQLKTAFSSCQIIILAQENDRHENEYLLKVSDNFYASVRHERISKILDSELSGVITADDIVAYSLPDSFPASLILHDNFDVLLITNSKVLKSAARKVSWWVIDSYNYAELNHEDHAALNKMLVSIDSDKNELHIYVDIDHTLLNRAATKLKRKAVLNTSVVNLLDQIQEKFLRAEFYIITSRAPPKKKDSVDEPVGLESVVRELYSLTSIYIIECFYTGRYLDAKNIAILCDKVSIIRHNEHNHPSPGDGILFFDDNLDEIKRARERIEDFARAGVTFVPVLIQCNGDLPRNSQRFIRDLIAQDKKEPEPMESQVRQGFFRRVLNTMCGCHEATFRRLIRTPQDEPGAVAGPSCSHE